MTSVQELKAGLAASAATGDTTNAQIRACMESASQMLARLQVIARGTKHPKVQEAVAKVQQCQQRLNEAAMLAQAAAQNARDYIGHLG